MYDHLRISLKMWLTCAAQLRFASGSLVQFLSVHYAEKLVASSTVDDVESTLKQFVPPGAHFFEQ
jgi:hypothetical protein